MLLCSIFLMILSNMFQSFWDGVRDIWGKLHSSKLTISSQFYCINFLVLNNLLFLEFTMEDMFVCFEALRPSQQFFSHVGTEPTLPGFNQYCWVLMCLAQGHNTMTPVGIEPRTSRFGVRHSTTMPPRSHMEDLHS